MKLFQVKQVSNIVQSNFGAWSTTVSSHETREEAEEAAQKHWESLCAAADDAGNDYVGFSVYVSGPAQ